MFFVGLMRVVLTFSAVCSQKMYFFCRDGCIPYLMKIHMKISESHKKGNKCLRSFGFLSIGLTS